MSWLKRFLVREEPKRAPPRHHYCYEDGRLFWFAPTSFFSCAVTCQCDEEFGRSDCPIHGPTGQMLYDVLAAEYVILKGR